MSNDQATKGHGHEGHGHDHGQSAHVGHLREPASVAKVTDPVCGMMVDPHTTAHRAQYEGKPYLLLLVGLPVEVHGRAREIRASRNRK